MEALVTRSDAQLAQRAIRLGWGFSEEEKAEIKQVALKLVRHKATKANARGVALCVAMQGQDIKLAIKDDEANKPQAPAVIVQTNHISVSEAAIVATLDRIQKRQTIKQEVIENAPPATLSDQAPEGLDAQK